MFRDVHHIYFQLSSLYFTSQRTTSRSNKVAVFPNVLFLPFYFIYLCIFIVMWQSILKYSSLFVVLQDGKVDQKWKWPLGRLQTTVTVQVCLSFHFIWQQKNSPRNVSLKRLEDACIHRLSVYAHASSLLSQASDVILLESSVLTHHANTVNLRKKEKKAVSLNLRFWFPKKVYTCGWHPKQPVSFETLLYVAFLVI